jgi:hypothetical protein
LARNAILYALKKTAPDWSFSTKFQPLAVLGVMAGRPEIGRSDVKERRPTVGLQARVFHKSEYRSGNIPNPIAAIPLSWSA